MAEWLVDFIGWLGAAALLIPYYLVSTGKLRGESKAFQLANLLGSILLIINSLYHGALPSVLVNIVWIAIGVTMLVRMSGKEMESENVN